MTMKSSKSIEICEKVSKGAIYLSVFLLPIFFLPWTTNVLDFNKQALLIVLVFISLFAWMLKALISGKLSLSLNRVHILVIVLFLVYLISTIFSSFSYGSFWGWPQVTSESLLSLLSLAMLYFLVINIFEKREIFYLIILLVFSSFLAILFGIFQLFGKFLFPIDFTKLRSFNTIGEANDLAVFTAVLLPLIIVLITISAKRFLRIFLVVTAILGIILLLLVNFLVAWWIIIAGSALIIVFGSQKRDSFDSRWLTLPMFFLILALLFSLFKFQIPGAASRPIEVFLTQRATFNISWQSLKDNLIFGSGPGTFVYDFSKYKDISFNQSLFWNARFEWGISKFLTILATTGILGVLSFLALIGFLGFLGIKFLFREPARTRHNFADVGGSVAGGTDRKQTKVPSKTEERLNERFLWNLNFGIFVSFITLSIGYFFYRSNLSLDFIYFLLIAAFISLLSLPKKEFLLKPSSLVTLGVTSVFILVFILGFGLLVLEGQRYAAAVTYFKGVKAWQQGETNTTLEYLEKAVRRNPRVDLYQRELSQVYLQKAREEAARTDLSTEEISQRTQLFINNAVNTAKTATDIVNSKNVANWSVRGSIYQNLIGVVNGAEDWAVKSYEEALALEPTNPYFPTQAGISLLRKINFLPQERTREKEITLAEAQEQFKKAIELKSDYAPAHFQLAVVFQALGWRSEAIEELEKAKESAPGDVGLAFQLGLIYYQSKDYQKAKAELERAVFLNPNYANALYFLGLTYDQLGKKEIAIEKFERILTLNPDNLEVKKILENLRAGKKALEKIVEQVPPIVPIEEEPPELEE